MTRLLKYASSDIHGMYHNKFIPTLKSYGLIDDDLEWISSDRIIFCGDYVDGGLNGYETLKLIKKYCDEGHAIALMGNHDALSACLAMFYRYKGYHHPFYKRDFDANGGRMQDLTSLIEDKELLDWLKNLPLTHIENNVIYQHSDMCYFNGTEPIYSYDRTNPDGLFEMWVNLTEGRRWRGYGPKQVLEYLEHLDCTHVVHGHTFEANQVSWNKEANIFNINDYIKENKLWSLEQKNAKRRLKN